jgi:hypothetical protein
MEVKKDKVFEKFGIEHYKVGDIGITVTSRSVYVVNYRNGIEGEYLPKNYTYEEVLKSLKNGTISDEMYEELTNNLVVGC